MLENCLVVWEPAPPSINTLELLGGQNTSYRIIHFNMMNVGEVVGNRPDILLSGLKYVLSDRECE